MNKRQVIILWVIAIALGLAVTAVKITQEKSSNSATARTAGQTLFEAFPAEQTRHIEIQSADNSVTLIQKDGKWTVSQRDDYPANTSAVLEFLRTMSDLKVTRGMEAGPSFAPRFGMDETSHQAANRGITATFKDALGKEIAKVTLGKNIENGAEPSAMGMTGSSAVGRYIRNHADPSGFYAVSEMFPSISADAPRWLNPGFISLEKIKSIALTQQGNEQIAWKLVRDSEDAEFKLEGATSAEVLNIERVTPLKTFLSYANFDDVVTTAQVTERADLSGKRIATIETIEGFTYTLHITPAKGSPDKFLMTIDVNAEIPKERKKEAGEKPEDAQTKDRAFTELVKNLTEKLAKEKSLAGRTFEISKSTVEDLLKDRKDLTTEATPPAAANSNTGAAVQQLPGGLIAPPPPSSTVTSPPVSAQPVNQSPPAK